MAHPILIDDPAPFAEPNRDRANSRHPKGQSSHPSSGTRDFHVHPSVLRYALPLSKFCRLPSNLGKQVWVGLIIVEKGEAGATALLVGRPPALPLSSADPLCSSLDAGIRTEVEAQGQNQCPLSASPLSANPNQVHNPRTTLQPFETFDLPSLQATLGTDQTLLETVARCALLTTGRAVKQIVTILGVEEYPLVEAVPLVPARPDSSAGLVGGEGMSGKEGPPRAELMKGRGGVSAHEECKTARRYDFLVKLHPGQTVVPEGWEGKWVGTDESWRVMKRIPRSVIPVKTGRIKEMLTSCV